jgi:hypothetical protein
VVHLDCRRPRRLSFEERALLYEYCWDHAVGECVSCARSFRPHEFLSGLLGNTDLCPHCRKDLTASVRAHLYSCSMLPEEVRRRARETRTAAQKLVRRSGQLQDRVADVLMHETEVALAALRAAMKESAAEALRLVIRSKLRDGRLPYDDIPATIPGRPGDNSVCIACDHVVTSRTLMMIVTRQASPGSPPNVPIPFHADCFELWNEERRTLKPSS